VDTVDYRIMAYACSELAADNEATTGECDTTSGQVVVRGYWYYAIPAYNAKVLLMLISCLAALMLDQGIEWGTADKHFASLALAISTSLLEDGIFPMTVIGSDV